MARPKQTPGPWVDNGTAYIIVPYDDFDPDVPPKPCKAEDAGFFRIFALTRSEMEERGDFPTFAEAQGQVRLVSGGKAEGRLFESESFYDLPGFGRWPDVQPLWAELKDQGDPAAVARPGDGSQVEPLASPAAGRPLPSPGEIAREDGPTFAQIRSILAERRQVAILWTVDDVQAVRPDLDEDQAWKVLQDVEHGHDGNFGVTFDTLESASQRLFPDADPVTTVWARGLAAERGAEAQPLPSPGEIAEDRDGPGPPSPHRGDQRGR